MTDHVEGTDTERPSKHLGTAKSTCQCSRHRTEAERDSLLARVTELEGALRTIAETGPPEWRIPKMRNVTAATWYIARQALSHSTYTEKCPTCGSDDPARRGGAWSTSRQEWGTGQEPCPDPWHTGKG